MSRHTAADGLGGGSEVRLAPENHFTDNCKSRTLRDMVAYLNPFLRGTDMELSR